MHHRQPFRSLLIVAGGVLALATSPAVRADIIGACTPTSYDYVVTNLPDFDQVREPLPPHIDGLPGNGVNYCVPTATLDVLAYAASHGFPQMLPGVANWKSASTYNLATSKIAQVGSRMGTDPDDGTYPAGHITALIGIIGQAPILPPGKLFATGGWTKGNYTPRLSGWTKSAINHNGLLTIGHGWYDFHGFTPNGLAIVSRDGGHHLAVQAVAGTAPGADLALRDPGTDNDIFTKQSPFVSNGYWAQAETVCIGPSWPFCATRTMTVLHPYGVPGPTYQYMDSAVLIATVGAYTFDQDFDIVFLKPIKYTGTNPPTTRTFPAPPGVGSILDMVVLPDLNGVLLVTDQNVYVVDINEDAVVPAAPPGTFQAPRRAVFGKHRGLYVLDRAVVVSIDLDAPDPEVLGTVLPPNPCTEIAYDDAAEEIVLLSPESRAIVRYPWHLDAPAEVMPIPAEAELGESPLMRTSAADGLTWIVNRDLGAIHRLETDEGELHASSWFDPRLSEVTSFDIGDDGNLFVIIGGEMREFAFGEVEEDLVSVEDSPFHGLPAHHTLRLDHSRSNADPNEHIGPEWRNVFPEVFGDPVPECLADIHPADGDGDVDFDDLLRILTAWGPCESCREDIEPFGGNGRVGFEDLLLILSSWGPCE